MREERCGRGVYPFLNVPRHVMKLRQTPPLLFVYLNRDRARAKRNEFGEESVGRARRCVSSVSLCFSFQIGQTLSLAFFCASTGDSSRERPLVFGFLIVFWFLFWLAKRLWAFRIFPLPDTNDTLGLTAYQRHTEHSMAVPIWQAGFLGWVPGMERRLGGAGALLCSGFGKERLVHHAVTTDTPQHTPDCGCVYFSSLRCYYLLSILFPFLPARITSCAFSCEMGGRVVWSPTSRMEPAMGTAKIGEERRKRGHPLNKNEKKKRIPRLWTGCAVLETSCDRSSYAFQYRVSSVIYLPFFPSEEVIRGCHWSASRRVHGARGGV
jgi:hypothetical protein